MIYVSPLMSCLTNKNWRWNQVSHMVADSERELLDFAISIGLKPAWIQRKTVTHFDLTPSKFRMACSQGAILHTIREHGRFIREHRIIVGGAP